MIVIYSKIVLLIILIPTMSDVIFIISISHKLLYLTQDIFITVEEIVNQSSCTTVMTNLLVTKITCQLDLIFIEVYIHLRVHVSYKYK